MVGKHQGQIEDLKEALVVAQKSIVEELVQSSGRGKSLVVVD
jgi:hypothetical protein